MERSVQSRKNIICVWYGKGTKHRDNGGQLSSPLPKVTQPNVSLYNACLLLVAGPPLEPRVHAYEWDSVSWLFKKVPVLLAVSHLPGEQNLTDFDKQKLCGLLFLALMFQAGDPTMGLKPLASQVEPL